MADDDDLIVESDVMVPMRDGISLRADVFRPTHSGPTPGPGTALPLQPA